MLWVLTEEHHSTPKAPDLSPGHWNSCQLHPLHTQPHSPAYPSSRCFSSSLPGGPDTTCPSGRFSLPCFTTPPCSASPIVGKLSILPLCPPPRGLFVPQHYLQHTGSLLCTSYQVVNSVRTFFCIFKVQNRAGLIRVARLYARLNVQRAAP